MIRIFLWANLLLVLAAFACKNPAPDPGTVPAATAPGWTALTYAPDGPGLDTNPLRGFVPFEWEANNPAGLTTMPFSLEFFYIPLSRVMTGPDRFDWSSFETTLNRIKGRGNHALPRFYVDYPSRDAQNFPLGMPAYLVEAGVPMRAYTELDNTVSRAPDWNDERLLSALEAFAKAYGAKYDGDLRLGLVQVGLYGFWGEWHTYPYQPDGTLGKDWRMAEAGRNRVLRAFRSAFTKTAIQVRDPLATSDAALKTAFGYHDDSFAYNTLELNWYFLPKLVQNGLADNWKQQQVGGELRPEVQLSIFNQVPNSRIDKSEDWTASVNATHCSWLMAYALFAKQFGGTATQLANARKEGRKLGYQLTVSEAKLGDVGKTDPVSVSVRLLNKGVAPFPYNWPVEFSALPVAGGSATVLGSSDVKLKEILPGVDASGSNAYERQFSAPHTLPAGQYRLRMRVKTPLEGGSPLRFANATQDAHQPGYLTLGTFRVQ